MTEMQRVRVADLNLDEHVGERVMLSDGASGLLLAVDQSRADVGSTWLNIATGGSDTVSGFWPSDEDCDVWPYA